MGQLRQFVYILANIFAFYWIKMPILYQLYVFITFFRVGILFMNLLCSARVVVVGTSSSELYVSFRPCPFVSFCRRVEWLCRGH